MSFNWYARKARNPEWPMRVRRSALYSAILRLAWLTHEGFHATVDRYDAPYGFSDRDVSEAALLAALTAIERDRNQILERVRTYEHTRIRAKMRGHRRPSNAEALAWRELVHLPEPPMPPPTATRRPQYAAPPADPARPTPDSFYYNRGASPVGILLLHGWTGSPPEMQPMGEYLAAQGWTVHGPLLPGHGTQPEDLRRVSERDWIAATHAAYDAIAAECATVFVGGLSMGGLLTLYLGATLPRPPAGLIAMSAPIYINDWRRFLAPAAPLLTRFQPWSHKGPTRNDVDPTTGTRLWDYRRYPTISGQHIVRLMNLVRGRLPAVRAPLLIMQGRQDHTVVPASAQYIYDHVTSPDRTLVWWDRSAHCITVDAERAAVWSRTATWIAAHLSSE